MATDPVARRGLLRCRVITWRHVMDSPDVFDGCAAIVLLPAREKTRWPRAKWGLVADALRDAADRGTVIVAVVPPAHGTTKAMTAPKSRARIVYLAERVTGWRVREVTDGPGYKQVAVEIDGTTRTFDAPLETGTWPAGHVPVRLGRRGGQQQEPDRQNVALLHLDQLFRQRYGLVVGPEMSRRPSPMKVTFEPLGDESPMWHPYWRSRAGMFCMVPEELARGQAAVDLARSYIAAARPHRYRAATPTPAKAKEPAWEPEIGVAWNFDVPNRPGTVVIRDSRGRSHEVELRPQEKRVLERLHARRWASWSMADLAKAADTDSLRIEGLISKIRGRLRNAGVDPNWTRAQIVYSENKYGLGAR